MYQPSQLRLFLDSLGGRAKKGLSQNFLIDGNIIRKIIEAAQVVPNDLVLEIGPGPGALTQALLDAGAQVIAVEKDPALAEALPRLAGPQHQLEVFCADIMTFPVAEKLSERLSKGTRAKLIANLPYHLTTPILTRFVPLHGLFQRLTLMVQKEVARRMIASPGCGDYSSLTLYLHFYAQTHLAFTVSRHCFYPQPNVDSAVVNLIPHLPLEVSDQEAFFQLTRTAFEQRRKMLRRSLNELYSPDAVTEALVELGLNPCARPEELSVQSFCLLFEHLQKSR